MKLKNQKIEGISFEGELLIIKAEYLEYGNVVNFYWGFKCYGDLYFIVGIIPKGEDKFKDVVNTIFENGYLYKQIKMECKSLLRDDCTTPELHREEMRTLADAVLHELDSLGVK